MLTVRFAAPVLIGVPRVPTLPVPDERFTLVKLKLRAGACTMVPEPPALSVRVLVPTGLALIVMLPFEAVPVERMTIGELRGFANVKFPLVFRSKVPPEDEAMSVNDVLLLM